MRLLENSKLKIFSEYVLWFTFCSFIGWGFEMLYFLNLRGHFVDRGFLHLPICPIYGFVALFLILIFSRTKKRWWAVYIVSTVVLTVIEYVTHYILEKVFHTQWWTYYWKLNINGRVALWSSLFFGLLSLFLIKCLHPLMKKVTSRIPGAVVIPLGLIIAAAVTVDFVYTCAQNLNLI